jgi:hypothetical protein
LAAVGVERIRRERERRVNEDVLMEANMTRLLNRELDKERGRTEGDIIALCTERVRR